MAAIDIADCTVTDLAQAGGMRVVQIVTPATADDGDTIDVSSLFTTWKIAHVHGATDTTVLAVDSPTTLTITLPGSTDNEARTIIAYGA